MNHRSRSYKPAGLALSLILLLSFFSNAEAQTQKMRYAVRGDSAYIYHIKSLRPGQGFNIYKKGKDESAFRQLNRKVVRGITYASELPSALGEDIYEQIHSDLEAQNASDMFFKLTANSVTGRLYSFVYPEVGRALGRLFVDHSLEIGETATYKIEFVNDLGEPTGEALTQQFTMREHTPQSPSGLEIENEGYQLTIAWEYPEMGSEDDKVVRFNVYQQDPADGATQLINKSVIIRESDRKSYTYRFQVEQLGVQRDYFLAAVDITGQPGPPSEMASHYLVDNIPPSRVSRVEAEYVNETIEISWPVSPEPDLAGYQVYRSRDIREGYKRLNSQLLKPLQTIYQDSAVEEGNQYFYKVTALDSAGNESSRSAAAMKLIADSTPPNQPHNVETEFLATGTVNLRWQLSPEPEDLRRFIVLRKRMSSQDSQTYSQLTERDFTGNAYNDTGEADKGFTEGAFYQYGILAADSSRNFSDTTFVEIQIPDMTPPEKPSFVRADNNDGIRVNVSWNSTPSGDAVKYTAYRQPLDSTRSKIRVLPISQNRFRDETTKLGMRYRYAISAIDSAGNESEPTFSDTVWVRDYDPPRSVRNIQVRPVGAGKGYQISWEPVVAKDLKGYNVYYSSMSTGVYTLLTDEPISKTSMKDLNGEAGRWYRVVAVDISGNESRPGDPVKAP